MKRSASLGYRLLLLGLPAILGALPLRSAPPEHASEPSRGQRRTRLLAGREVRPLDDIASPADNPAMPEKIALGKRLFFEPLLSGSNRNSCASCHQSEHGYADPRRLSTGDDGKTVTRNTPSLLNVAYNATLFWDGRTSSLEDQALMPIVNPSEMNQDVEALLGELRQAGYEPEFRRVFPEDGLTKRNLARALAAFERTLTLTNTRLDRWLRGEKEAMRYEAIRGLLVFVGEKANCVACHGGANLTRAVAGNSASFVRLGVKTVSGDPPDFGRAAAPGEHPRAEQLFARTGAFRIPPLRGIRDTAPYMHNGSLKTLEEVIAFYDRGGDEGLLPALDLTEDEKSYLLVFLREGLSQ